MNLVLSDCLSAMRTVLTKAGISPDYVEKYMQEWVNELGAQEHVKGHVVNVAPGYSYIYDPVLDCHKRIIE